MKRTTTVRMAWVGLAAFSLVWYGAITLPQLRGTSFDDAYMFLRYAKHWWSGMGFSWNQDEGPAYGVTSVSYLLIVTAVRGLTNLPDPVVLTAISFAAGLASLVVMTLTGFAFFRQLRRYWMPVLVIPGMALGRHFAYHSTTGMETTLAVLCNALLAASVLLFAEHRSRTSLIVCLVSAYACFLTRPDNGLYSLLLPPLFLIAVDRRDWKPGLYYVAAFCVILLIDLLVKKVVFGDFLPLPFFAKSTGSYRGYVGADKWNAARQTFLFFRQSLPFLVVILCFVPRVALRRLGAILIPMLLTFGYYATVTQIMGWNARYYYPSLPFLVLGAFIAGDSYADTRARAPDGVHGQCRSSLLRAGACLILLLALIPSDVEGLAARMWKKWVIGRPTHFLAQRSYAVRAAKGLPRLGWWQAIREMDSLLRYLPPDVAVAASECGFIGSQHPTMRMLDLAGVNDRYLAHHGFSAQYVFSKRPDIIWLPHPDYTYAVREILDSDQFVARYEYYPHAYDYGLAIRKDSPFAETVHARLEREFSRIYQGRRMSDYKAEPLDPAEGG